MALIERLSADKPAKSGPEKYAPPDRRAPETLSDADHIAFLHRQRSEVDAANGPAEENLNALIGRVASTSMEEIDRVTSELQSVRNMLHNEGERLSREINGYASLNHAAATVMKVIADSIKQWKSAPDNSGAGARGAD